MFVLKGKKKVIIYQGDGFKNVVDVKVLVDLGMQVDNQFETFIKETCIYDDMSS